MDALFLHILNTAITAGWLVLAVVLARVLLKKAPAWIKCALWAIVALRLVWPFEFESILSLVPCSQTIPQSQLYAYAPQVNTGIGSLNTAINPVFTETFRSEPANSVNPLQAATAVAAWVWVIGMLVMAGYAAFSYLRLRRRVRFSIPAGKGVYLCDQIPAPFILGIIKPKIYLPADLPQEKWGSILAHERAHLARHDHWWKPLGFLLLSVFWFHPLLWLAYILLCRDVELACDERVIRALTAEEKQDYSNTLLECSIPGRWITACPLAFGETGVKQRIRAVLHYKKPTLWILIIALVACTVLAVCFLTDPEPEPITEEDVVGKMYVYAQEGFGGEFTIRIGEYGFQYYEGLYSSHVGEGDWEIKDGKLYLYDEGLDHTRTYVFSVQGDCLIFRAAESDRFTYVSVPNKAIFYAGQRSELEQPLQQSLMWVQIESYGEGFLYVLDADGNRWKVLYEEPLDEQACALNECWVSYYGKPKEIQMQLSDGSVVNYEVVAERCWIALERPAELPEDSPLLQSFGWPSTIYDHCRYDIDADGTEELCVLSSGHTSGVPTFMFSVWENGVLENEKWVYEFPEWGYGAAFVQTENGLTAVNSAGVYFTFVYADGEIRVITEDGYIQ